MVATHGHSIATLIILVAIGETLYCHHKYLVAIGCNSIATLNIVVTIGGALCCHDKCLVARGCRSIAIDGSFYRHDQHLVSILGPSIATHIVSLV